MGDDLLDKTFLSAFLILGVLFILDVYATGRGRGSTPYIELLAAFFAGLYAGRIFPIGKVALASFVIFAFSWILDPLLYSLLGWAAGGYIRWLYLNIAAAYCLLFGAVISNQYIKKQ